MPTVSPILRLRRQRGFTLVEMLVVGALIAVFSALAVFGVQQQFNSNIRKATIGETRQLAQALDFANLDTNLFPRLCFMTEGVVGLDFLSLQSSNNNSVLQTYRFLDIYGRASTDLASSLQVGARNRSNWDGPYFNMSQARDGVSQGRGGSVQMVLPEFAGLSSDPESPANRGFRWPADPYTNPYMIYMLDLDLTQGPSVPRLRFVSERNAQDSSLKGNYTNAVVSYGRNQYPGGGDEVRPAAGANLGDLNTVGTGQWRFRLYYGNPASRQLRLAPLGGIAGVDDPALLADRASIWSAQFAGQSGERLTNTADYPSDGSGRLIGIADPGTDDVVFEF